VSLELDQVIADPKVQALRELHTTLIAEERRLHGQAMEVKHKLIAREREVWDAIRQ
jgi:hypothetical protein